MRGRCVGPSGRAKITPLDDDPNCIHARAKYRITTQRRARIFIRVRVRRRVGYYARDLERNTSMAPPKTTRDNKWVRSNRRRI